MLCLVTHGKNRQLERTERTKVDDVFSAALTPINLVRNSVLVL